MQRMIFSADELPVELDDQARFSLWRDIYTTNFLQTGDVVRLHDKSFFATWQHAQFGGSLVAQFEGTLNRVSRNAQQVAAHPVENFCISFSRGPSRQSMAQRGREVLLNTEAAVFFSLSEALDCRTDEGENRIGVSFPRQQLLDRIPHAEDLVLAPLDPGNAALRHLRWYLDFLLRNDNGTRDQALSAHVEITLLDLAGLALGIARDDAEVARLRGLRGTRLQQILAEIAAGFADPAFAPASVAAKLNLSPRYIQDILQESGATFSERVLERRLQKTRNMLMSGAMPRRKISEIALTCGFSDVSYFNQAFRRRFGAPPTHFRAGH